MQSSRLLGFVAESLHKALGFLDMVALWKREKKLQNDNESEVPKRKYYSPFKLTTQRPQQERKVKPLNYYIEDVKLLPTFLIE